LELSRGKTAKVETVRANRHLHPMLHVVQPSLFLNPDLPEGFRYQPNFITRAQEADLLSRLPDLDFKPFDFHGYQGKRRVIYFGWRYDFTAGKIGQADPIPDFLLSLRDEAAAFAGLPPEAFAHVLVNEYEPGAPIGWHRDRPQFEDVVGISLGAPNKFRFRRKQGTGWERKAMTVEPRSAYLLRGPVRTEWEHSLPPAEALRYSITFRSLKAGVV
jgi:alkylated DNA repair dioxygenase AlkB